MHLPFSVRVFGHFFNIICPERIITIRLVMAASRVGAKVAFRVKI
jgi:hypothetical protein